VSPAAAGILGGQYRRRLPAHRPVAGEHLLHHGFTRFTTRRAAPTVPGTGLAGAAARLGAVRGVRPGWTEWLRDDAVVCRREEVTTAELRNAAESTGSRGLRSPKLGTRAALGACPGPMCGRGAEDRLARTSGDLFDAGLPIAGQVRSGRPAVDVVSPRKESG
jgi:hypothetical protein